MDAAVVPRHHFKRRGTPVPFCQVAGGKRMLLAPAAEAALLEKDLAKLPIVDSFSQVKFPTKNDIVKLLSNYPFQIR